MYSITQQKRGSYEEFVYEVEGRSEHDEQSKVLELCSVLIKLSNCSPDEIQFCIKKVPQTGATEQEHKEKKYDIRISQADADGKGDESSSDGEGIGVV